TTTGSVSVAQGTTPGAYTLTYSLCSTLGTTTCTTGLVSVTVTPSVTANPDAGTASAGTGGVAVANVTTNDVVNGQPATLGGAGNATLAAVGTYPTGITLDPTTGSISVAVGTTPGSYTLAYQLCDKLTPTTCTTGLVSITVTPTITAAPDAGTASAGTGGTPVANVRANDLVNGQPATSANSSLSLVSSNSSGITLNTTTGSVSVTQGTAPGSYTLAYTLCSTLGTTTCTTGLVSVTVTPSVTANPDAGTAGALLGGTAVANVAANDAVNGLSATLGGSGNATVTQVGTYPIGISLNTTNGAVSVAAGTAPGSYTLAYQLCDRLTPATCATTVVSVTVIAGTAASPDAGTASAGTGGTAVVNVAANDVINGQSATLGTGGNATVATVGTYPPGITLNTTGSVSVAQGTTPGSYTIAYQICDRLTQLTCATAIVSITVTPSVTANPDAGTASAGTGGVAVANVTTNDVVNGQPATLGGAGNATLATVGTYPTGITLDPTTGSISVAVGTTPGSYTLAYQLCDKLTPVTCTTGLVSITVTPTITAAPDAGTASAGTGGTPVANVRANDLVNGQPAT
ncbi:beta strand repeat-containing protein, partial [Spirosoma soli]